MLADGTKKIVSCKSDDRRANAFDEFVAKYIVFVAAAKALVSDDAEHKSDKKCCTVKISTFLSDVADELVTDLNSSVNLLCRTIEEEKLIVVSHNKKNPRLQRNWTKADNKEKLKSLLEFLYYIRCNLFHGDKEYSSHQVPLLEAANVCLEIITNTLFIQLNRLKDE